MDKIKDVLIKGIKLFYNSNYTEAISVLKPIYDERNDIESGYHLALCYTQVKNFDQALDTFDKIIKRIPNQLRLMQIHIIIGYIYSMKGMYDLAEFELKEAIKFGVENVQIYSSLGYIYYKKDEINLATSFLQKAISLDPNNANARNSLGFILADTQTDIEAGIKEIKHALEIDNDNPAYLDSLGWAYMQKKDFFNARRFLTRAFEHAPNVGDIKDHIRLLEQVSPSGKKKNV